MKCALLIPAWQPDELFSKKTAASQLNYWQPLGTLYVAASLQKAGHQVEFFNGAFLSHAQILEKLKKSKPQFVGIYATTFGWYKALSTASSVKNIFPQCFICVGGPYPIATQSECLDQNYQIDAVVTGEGEETVPELVNWLESRPIVGQTVCEIAGIAYRLDGKTILNPERPLIENIDTIPFPARELLHDSNDYLPPPASYKRKPVAVVLTSRGCNRRCIFCSQIDKHRRSGQRGIRYRRVDSILQEIELCLSQGYREIKFIDDSLAADYHRLTELCTEIISRQLDFSWFASACVNQVDRTLLMLMKKAGCWAILFGVESGVQRNLNILRKGITIAQIERAVQTAQQVGLKVNTSFLFGIPGQTFTDGLATIDFAIRLNPDFANFHALSAFPGTYLYDNLKNYGHTSHDLQDYTYQGASFIPYTMNRTQIQTLRRLAFRRFYLRPAYIFRKIRLLIVNREYSRDEMSSVWKGLVSLLWICFDKGIFQRPSNQTKPVKQPSI